MIRKILSTIIALLCLFMTFPIDAKEQDPRKQVIVVLVNHLSLEDVRLMEQLPDAEWLEKGTLGAMNLRTAASISDVDNVVTMSSGSRATGSMEALQAFAGHEMIDGSLAVDVYRQLTGRLGMAESVYVPGYRYVWKANEDQPYKVIPGFLGKRLHEHRMTTAVLGNSDLGKQAFRFAPLFTMDQYGMVDKGNVSSQTVEKNPNRVYGVVTDYDFLLQQTNSYDQESLITIELGDLYRLSSMKNAIEDELFVSSKENILRDINRFMSRLTASQREGQMILLLSPMVSPEAESDRSMMAPYFQITANKGKGILYTSTTKQPNMVANVDVAPTILQWLRIPAPREMMGRPVTMVQGEHAFWQEWELIKHIYSTRTDVLYGYVTFQVAILILATAFWYFAKSEYPYYRTFNHIIRFLLLIITLSPFMFLVLPVLPMIKHVGLTIVFLLIFGTALSAALIRLPFAWVFFLISLVNWVPILLDGIWLNSALMKRSYLGYDPIIGARYYGIGNEYMGVVIGSSILCLAMLLELTKRNRRLIQFLFMSVFLLYLVFFALPGWGTNAGGAITAVAAYCTSFVRLFDIQINRKYLFWGCLAVFMSLGSLFFVNMLGDDQAQSHIGRAMQSLVGGDWKEIFNIIERKLAMNWKLIGVSSWSKVFITSILILGFLCYRPSGVIRMLSKKYPYAIRGFFGIIIGAFTGLLVNDSGIVAAATTIVYMIVPLLFVGLKEKMG